MSRFFTKKRVIWTIIILLVVGPIVYRIVKGKNPGNNITTDTVKKQDLKQTVLATGQVVSSTDLELSFKTSGVVNQVNVKEGDNVKAGQTLAVLDQKDSLASLTTARGSLAAAEANYNKVLAGASSQDVAVSQEAVAAAQVALDNAKNNLAVTQQQQDTAVKNAYSALLNSTIAAVPAANNLSTVSITVTGTYNGTEQGVYKISTYQGSTGLRFLAYGLETGDGDARTTVASPLGKNGLYIQFSGTPASSDTWTIAIPNTLASNYVTNYNAYQAALKASDSAIATAQAQVSSAQTSLDQANAALALKQAQARPADVQAAEAQILSAQGQVQAAAATLDNTIIRAPSDGTITSVDVKVGELATALKEALILQDVGNLHVEANVSEANIADIKPGQDVDVTFDALGPDRHFKAKVETVNPASTVVSGVVNYKVTASLDSIQDIKPGMTANMTILTGQKSGALAIPSRAIINNADGTKSVRVVDDSKKKTYHETTVQAGMEADGGLTEIVSGLKEGQEIVTYIKQ